MVENKLFNEKIMNDYITRHEQELLNQIKDKNSIQIWIDKLNNNELHDEIKNYSKFTSYILNNILGYTPEDYIDQESIGDEKRPVDYVLLKNNKKYVAVELKGTSTPDITKRHKRENSAVEQACLYATEQEETEWAIDSNYDEFRLFNPKSRNNYISFRFRELTDDIALKKFLLCFSKFSLIDENLPKTLIKQSTIFEREFEDEFYQLFSETRLMLIKELEYSSEDIDRHEAIRLAQLILNSYIFICFAEDLNLLPPLTSTNTIMTPIENANLRKNTIWNRLNELFFFVNEGNPQKGINEFNGGLFGEELDDFKIRDMVDDLTFFDDCYKKWKFEEQYEKIKPLIENYKDVLNPIYKNLLTISEFDFDSQLDVNILGHLFENSIGDIEELKNEDKTRRKKDGVFYTPEYITDYICRNTIIPYLSKSGEVNTVEELISEYNLSTKELEKLDEKLKNIKIVDPACGSGACLNKAVDILLEIHEHYHAARYANSKNNLDKWFDSVNSRRKILVNNIYGVDLNSESVDITKLSMFLKVATNGMKLPNLDKNIRCGNSIINDINIAGDKSFNWKTEFNEIKFDIVIGNPPWGADLSEKEEEYIKKNYSYPEYNINTYVVFLEKSFKLLKENGFLGFILPSSWIYMYYYKKIRTFLSENTELKKLLHLKYFAFEDVISESSIICYKKSKNKENNVLTKVLNTPEEFNTIDYKIIKQSYLKEKSEEGFLLNKNSLIDNLLNKMDTLNEHCIFITGIKPYQKNKGNPKQTKEDVKNKIYTSKEKLSEEYEPYLVGGNIYPYRIEYPTEQYIKYGDCLAEPRKSFNFKQKKIVIRQTSNKIYSAIDTKHYYNLNNAHDVIMKKNSKLTLEYVVALLNSKLLNYIYGQIVPEEGSAFSEVKIVNLKKLPIPTEYNEKVTEITKKVNLIISKSNELQNEINDFKEWLNSTFNLEKFSKKLNEYYKITFEEFLDELKKKKINVKPRDTYQLLKTEFNNSLNIITPLQNEVSNLINEIDKLVYELYDLTEEEINIIEESFE